MLSAQEFSAYTLSGFSPVLLQGGIFDTSKPSILLGHVHGDNLVLAKAISDVSNKVNVIFFICHNGQYLRAIPSENGFIPVPLQQYDYEHIQHPGLSHLKSGNAYDMERICTDKHLTHFILGRNNIPIPRQKRIKIQRNKDGSQISVHFNTAVPQVLKPKNGSGGKGVIMERFPKIGSSQTYTLHGVSGSHYICEDLIESYPITINEAPQDWNLRVLISYDTERGRYSTVGIVGRIGNQGGAINISLGAKNISFEEIGNLCGWNQNDFENIKEKVQTISEKTAEILVNAGNRKGKYNTDTNFQTLFGIDMIIDADMQPYVIEVNASRSGCMFEVASQKGIESIYPIAQSIVAKTMLLVAGKK